MTHDPRSSNAELLARLKRVECPDATFGAMTSPLVMDRASGSLVWDVEGREYIDLCAGFGVLALGHNSPALVSAFDARATTAARPPITHAMGDVYPSRAKIELLEYLTSILPRDLAYMSLAMTGGQAVELAAKTAILTTKKTGFVVFAGGYHGLDLGILPLTAREDFRAPFLSWLPNDAIERLPWGASPAEVDAALAALAARGRGAAAIVVEPVQGRAGVRLPPQGWLASLRKLADAHEALLIYDEVFTGLGRTGRMTAASDVPCDLLCLGKTLGGGLPLSAVVGTARSLGAWPESTGEALHTGTFFGHPLACEVSLATLRTIVNEALPARSMSLGGDVVKKLQSDLARFPIVKNVRGCGLMIGLEFHKPGLGVALMDALRPRGVIALCSGEKGETLSLTPALNIPEPLLAKALGQLSSAVSTLS